jgi:predicted alpha-1,2-mannosidase
MRSVFLISLLFITVSVFGQQNSGLTVDQVNPLMGTASKGDLSNGNTYPAVALPWGMNFWTAQTGKMGDGWQYTYDADKILGFKQTHQPSPWMNDYGMFSVFPETGKLKLNEEDRGSWFSHKAEVAKPDYYSVYLADYDVTTEITPSERAASFRFTFPKSDSSHILIDAFDKGSYVKVIPSERKIIGYSTKNSGAVTANFKNYFVIYIDKAFDLASVWHDWKLDDGKLEYKGDHAGAAITFKTNKGEQVHLKVASSFISLEQAELNLKRELGTDSFELTRLKARGIWNKTLNKIKVEGDDQAQIKTFYSCLYRMVFFPNKLYEVDKNNKIVHYSPFNGKVMPGYLYGGTGFWDTFRALYPFLNLVYPSVNKEMQEGLISAYKEGGWLPEWSSPGYADCMIGNNSASVVSEAYLKGGRGYDIETLYQALKHGANNEGPNATGRRGVGYYNSLGYVPYDVNINENVARTLEYAYDDFAIYRLGKALNKPESEVEVYKSRSLNYRNVFDKQTGLMRGKNKDGSFQTPFNAFKWGDAFTEGNSWHYSWSVFHDIGGLINLMGGKRQFVAKLDSVFTLPPVFDDSYYGGVIHEIREMQIANMGQYAHGNQPIQHMIYLYGYAGQPWKTQYWVRETMNKLYKATPDGYCGDEDNGQTSAWYVFSALGFYPVCPVAGQYVLGAPLFKKVTIALENGKQIIINAPDNSAGKRYVGTFYFNDKLHTQNWVSHQALLNGAVINIKMQKAPNFQRGTRDEDSPYSLSNDKNK